jgi:hypothetical protein
MKAPRRKPPDALAGAITDEREFKRLLHAKGAEWETLAPELARPWPKPTPEEYENARRRELEDSHAATHIPYDFLEEVAMSSKVDAWRRREHERVRFLLLNDMVAGDAREVALRLKRELENREWRHQ